MCVSICGYIYLYVGTCVYLYVGTFIIDINNVKEWKENIKRGEIK